MNKAAIQCADCFDFHAGHYPRVVAEEYSLLSEPPGVMADRCVVPYYTPESSGVIVYVMTNRGEVLRWRSPEPFQALGQALKWGLLGGIGLGLVLAAVLILRRKRPKQG